MRSSLAEQIRESVSMTDICRKYGFEITRGGYILCPFHNEKTASLKLYPKGFHCFGCGAGGSVIDFAMRYFGLDFRAAAGRLNYDFGLGLPAGRSMTYREKKRCTEAQRRQKQLAQARREAEERLEREYDRLFAAWQVLDACRTCLKPKTPLEPLNPFFVMALQELDYYEYLLDLKEAERRRRIGNAAACNPGQRDAGSGVDPGAVSVHDGAV